MAQNLRADEEESPPEVTAIVNQTVVFPDSAVLEGETVRLQASSAMYQAALQEVQSRNLQARADTVPPFGWTTMDESVLGDQVQSTTFMQDMGSDGTDYFGIMGFVVRGTDDKGLPMRKEMFEVVKMPMAGVADPSDIKTVALFMDDAKVAEGIQPLGILSRFIGCVRNKCASSCLGSLTTCVGVFPVYVKCVVVKCGGCAVKCGACAACNCGFWCKWATGCCKG